VQLDTRMTSQIVECFHKGKRVASHVRSHEQGRATTISSHMPRAHRDYAEWTPERFIKWGRNIGEHTAIAINLIMSKRRHPQLGFRACMGLTR